MLPLQALIPSIHPQMTTRLSKLIPARGAEPTWTVMTRLALHLRRAGWSSGGCLRRCGRLGGNQAGREPLY